MLNIYRYNFKGNILTNLLVIFVILMALLIPSTTQAVSVGVNYTNSWRYSKYIEGGSCSDFDAETNFTMSLSKQFDLYSTNLGNLNQNEWRIIRPGENITGINYGLTGSYNYSSGDKRTPPMDGQIKYWNYTSEPGWCNTKFEVRNQMRGDISKQLGYRLSSSDNGVIDCSVGSSCVAKEKDGTATITVSFPGKGSYYVERNYEWGNEYVCDGLSLAIVPQCKGKKKGDKYWLQKDSKYARQGFSYTLNSISYNVRVEIPNKPPTARYDSTSNIDYNTATANWSYSDPENQPQTNAEVKLYASPDYTNGQVFTGSTAVSNLRSLNITGLRPGTTYYPQVRVMDSQGSWSGWSNGIAFTTKVNNPPNLSQLTCKGKSEEPKYTSANLEWNYTGTDEPGDQLILKARWRREGESDWKLVDLPADTRTGNIDMNDLISGYKYDVQVSLNDNRNTHLGDRWENCGTVTPPNYPVPNVEFSLSSGDKTVQKGGTLTIKTGDSVNASWNITDSVGVIDNSCRLITTRILGDLDADIFEKGINRGFTGNNLLGKNLPVSLTDQKYKIELKCDGKDAKTKRDILESITLVLESYPVVSCSIVNGQRSVSSDNSSINLNIDVSNVDQYVWELKRDINDNWSTGPSSSPITNPIKLDYIGTAFGRYSPWVKVTKTGTNSKRSDETTCGTITNLGDSNIREVNP